MICINALYRFTLMTAKIQILNGTEMNCNFIIIYISIYKVSTIQYKT